MMITLITIRIQVANNNNDNNTDNNKLYFIANVCAPVN